MVLLFSGVEIAGANLIEDRQDKCNFFHLKTREERERGRERERERERER
jgi:hypothetical protein